MIQDMAFICRGIEMRYICFLLIFVVVGQAVAESATNSWSSSVGFGLNLSRATADTTQLNGDFSLSHKTEDHEFLHTLIAVYGETDENVSENNVNALLQWNQILASDNYLYGNSTFRYDDIANIDYRLLAGVGAGYYLVHKDDMVVAVETGPSYLVERLRVINDSVDGVAAGYQGEEEDEFMWRFSQRYKQTAGNASKLWESIEYLVGVGDTDRYFLNAQVGVDVPINSHFDLRLSIIDKYDSQPAPDAEANDLSMRVALIYRLLGK